VFASALQRGMESGTQRSNLGLLWFIELIVWRILTTQSITMGGRSEPVARQSPNVLPGHKRGTWSPVTAPFLWGCTDECSDEGTLIGQETANLRGAKKVEVRLSSFFNETRGRRLEEMIRNQGGAR